MQKEISVDAIEALKFKQGCHRQVIDFIHAWSKKNGRGKMYTFCTQDTNLIEKVLAHRSKADSASRYDFAQNNLDSSINDLCFYEGRVGSAISIPVMLVFKYMLEENWEYLVAHVICNELAFISASSEELAKKILDELVAHADKHETSNTTEGFAFNLGGN